MNMMLTVLLLVLASSCRGEQVAVEPHESTLRVDLQPPPEARLLSTRNVYQSWITMPVDHFDPHNPDTFEMRYMFSEEFVSENDAPIFIMAGGEWTISAGWLTTGNMYEMARENKGFQVYTEHRYYGQTKPYTDYTTANLRYLNVDQALADVAYFITSLKRNPRFTNSPVILYGGSYAGNMVLWFKQRYPHLVVGSVASSGPILAKVDYTEYLETVHAAIQLEGGEQCIATIKEGVEATVAALETAEGKALVEQTYRLCEPLDTSDKYTMGYFSGAITWSFSGQVQYARPGSLGELCDMFAGNSLGSTPMEKVAGFLTSGFGPNNCMAINYQNYVNNYMLSTESRAWYYQTCTEYGYFQTAPRQGTAFDSLTWLDVDFYLDMCRQAFDQRFDSDFVYAAVERTNRVFGGLGPDVNNTVNIHGLLDPWHAIGVTERDLKETSPTYTAARASHCFDMQPWLSTDTIQMSNVQRAARMHVATWIQHYRQNS